MAKKDKTIEKAYWDNFYKNWRIKVPSQFCVFVATEIEKNSTIVEFGSGNGRDSLFLASQGHPVVSMDISDQAIKNCQEAMNNQGIKHASFLCGDFSSAESVTTAIELARSKTENSQHNLVCYSRFVMHSIDEQQETAFLEALSRQLSTGDTLFFEFRSSEDKELKKHYDNHYRRFINSKHFIENLKEKYGFDITYQIVGQGMAKYKEEDPFVARICARKK